MLFMMFDYVLAPNPNIQEGVTDLPQVNIWDGIDLLYHEFREEWYQTIKNALGSVAQDGWTLLQTALNTDLGSPGNPCNPTQAVQSQNRNSRVFASIMAKIKPNCYVVRLAQRMFNSDGRGLYNFLS